MSTGFAYEEAVEAARSEAEKEVRGLLAGPEGLEALAETRRKYRERRAEANGELSAALAAHVAEVQGAHDALAAAQSELDTLRDDLASVDAKCASTAALVERYDLVAVLADAKANLCATLEGVEGVISLPEDAAVVTELLAEAAEDPQAMFSAWELLSELEERARRARKGFSAARGAARGASRLSNSATRIYGYFDDVEGASRRFEEALWGAVRDHALDAEPHRPLLVRAAQCIEAQSMLESRQAAEAADPAAVPDGKGWLDKLAATLEEAVDRHFAPLREPGATDDVQEALDRATDLLDALTGVYDYTTPCFPEHHGVFATAVGRFQHQVGLFLDVLSARGEAVSNAQVLVIVRWHSEYADQLRALGVEEAMLALPGIGALADEDKPGAEGGGVEVSLDQLLSGGGGGGGKAGANVLKKPGRGLSDMMNMYIRRVKKTLATWMHNTMAHDRREEPKSTSEGRLWTSAPVDFFRQLNVQFTMVQEVSTGELLLRTGRTMLDVMSDFSNALRESLHVPLAELTLERVAATMNNCVRSDDLTAELEETLQEALDEEQIEGEEGIDVAKVRRGFVDVAREAVGKISAVVFADPGLSAQFAKLFAGAAWESGDAVETLVATLRDYQTDVETYIDRSFYKRVMENWLERTVADYVAAFISRCTVVRAEMVERMKADEALLTEFFMSVGLKAAKVEAQAQLVADVREVAAADSVESFVLSFTVLLQNAPETQIGVAEKLLAMREDISKQDRREAVAQCKELIAVHASTTRR